MNKFAVIGLVAISALLGTAMQLARKYVMKSMDNYSIIFADSFITGFTMVCAALYFGGYDTIKKDLNKINGKTFIALFGTSLAITIVSVIGYTLLRTQRLSYLVIVSTGIGIVATTVAATMFLGDTMTIKKAVALPVLLLGVYLAQ